MPQVLPYLLNNWSELLGLLISTFAKIGVGNKWKYTPLIMFLGSVVWCIFGLLENHYPISVYHGTMAIYSLYSQNKWNQES